MADSSGKVAKLVQQKLEDYFNKHRVEKEFDSSGKGIHTTTPLVVQLELSYLQAAEEQWKRKTKEKKKNASSKKEEGLDKGAESHSKERAEPQSKNRVEKGKGSLKDGEGERGSRDAKNDGLDKKEEVRSKDGTDKPEQQGHRQSRDGDEGSPSEARSKDEPPQVSPKVTKNSKIKSRVKRSEIERITRNAQTAMDQVSVDRIHRVHRYRPNLIPNEYVDLSKVAHVSNHVNAILNTEHAWECAEENDDREAARKYVEEKNESENIKKREKARKEKSKNAAPAENTVKPKRSPLWLRMEIERAKQEKEKRKETNPQTEDRRDEGRRPLDQDASEDHQGETVDTGGVEDADIEGQEERAASGKDEGSEHDRARDGMSAEEKVFDEDKHEGDDKIDKELDVDDGDSLKDEDNVSQGSLRDLDSEHQVTNDCPTGQDDIHESESRQQNDNGDKNNPVSRVRGTRGGDVKEVTEHGEEVEREDEVELVETGSASDRDEGKRVVDEKGKETASRPGGSHPDDEGSVRTEEYIRAESMVSLTEISKDRDDSFA